MTVKELIRTLKRFPKTASVKITDADPTVRAQVNELNEWTVIIDANKNISEIGEKNPCINRKN
jgi:hypothetical protein